MENKRTKSLDHNVVSFIPTGDYYYEKAQQELARENTDKAYKYIKRAVELSPDDAQILLQYGILQMDLGKYEHAYESIHTAYSLEPSNPDVVYTLAEISGYIGFIADAQKFAELYLQLEPNGMYRLEAEDILQFAKEEEEFIVDLEDDDKTKIVAIERARRSMEDGDFQEAIEILEKTIDQYPTEWPAYNNLALAYFYLTEIEQAQALLHHVVRETNGTNLHALCNLAVIAYSQNEQQELASYVEVLSKIQPYNVENRHKLGVTLALIGEHSIAFKWLHSLYKKGYTGDAGFYFWLSNAAYFTGKEQFAHSIWDKLIEMDPSKEGLEPWSMEKFSATYSPVNDRDFIVEKLNSNATLDKIKGCFALSISPHKQEIIAHPKWINVDNFDEFERYALAYALGHPLNSKDTEQIVMQTAMDASRLIVEQTEQVNLFAMGSIDHVFNIVMLAFEQQQVIKHANGVAAAADYVFHQLMKKKVTKKAMAEKYETTTSTLTKYCTLYFELLPGIEEIVFN